MQHLLMNYVMIYSKLSCGKKATQSFLKASIVMSCKVINYCPSIAGGYKNVSITCNRA